MKYLTMARWLADQEPDADMAPTWAAVDGYRSYLESVRGQLLPDFQRLLDTICIHDARFLDLTVRADELTLALDAGDVTMREGRRVRLHYRDLVSFQIPADSPTGFPGVGLGDLLVDEIEVLVDCFEHRILFRSGIEFRIQFRQFQFEVLGRADPSTSAAGAA